MGESFIDQVLSRKPCSGVSILASRGTGFVLQRVLVEMWEVDGLLAGLGMLQKLPSKELPLR